MAVSFRGVQQDMFGLYVPAKWSSNVHNLPRMRCKDSLVALAAQIEAQVGDLLAGLSRASSDEKPNISNQKRVDAQWVYWSRDAAERQSLASFLEKMPLGDASIFTVAPHEKHASMALVLGGERLDVGVFVPSGASVDRRNLATKLGQSWERNAALTVLRGLPAEAIVRLGSEDVVPAHALGDADLVALGGKLTPAHGPLFVGLSWTPQEAEDAGADLADHIGVALSPLGALYRFAAWHRGNDAIDAGKQLQAEKAEKRRNATPFQKKDPVRIVGGLFRGQRGTVVECSDPRGQVKVLVGRMSVLIARDDLISA